MVAGLVFQVVSLAVYIALCAHFAWRVKKSTLPKNEAYESLRHSAKFKAFLFALALATLTIFVRCVFRVAELEGGFDGSLANNQTLFMILEGPMIIVAVAAMTVLHPGRVFGEAWHTATFSLRGAKREGQKKHGDVGQHVALREEKFESADQGTSVEGRLQDPMGSRHSEKGNGRV